MATTQMSTSTATRLHQGQPVLRHGVALSDARAAVVLIHGRGSSARDILSLADKLSDPDVVFLAPEAAGRTWYPTSFLQPLAQNEPFLSSALQAVGDVFSELGEAGVGAERIMLLGFSQGACLALEYAARNTKRYGAVVGLSGGLIGNGEQEAPLPDDKTFDYVRSMEGTPVFIGSSDIDPHIPLRRIEQSVKTFEQLGADVEKRVYRGMGHTINHDEIAFAADMLRMVTDPTSKADSAGITR